MTPFLDIEFFLIFLSLISDFFDFGNKNEEKPPKNEFQVRFRGLFSKKKRRKDNMQKLPILGGGEWGLLSNGQIWWVLEKNEGGILAIFLAGGGFLRVFVQIGNFLTKNANKSKKITKKRPK